MKPVQFQIVQLAFIHIWQRVPVPEGDELQKLMREVEEWDDWKSFLSNMSFQEAQLEYLNICAGLAQLELR